MNSRFIILLLALAALTPAAVLAEGSPKEAPVAQSGQIQVTGKVLDEKGEPLPGVTIIVKGDPTHGAFTDASGRFTISIPESGRTRLVISFVGMKTMEVVVSRQHASVSITMQPDEELLDEVVVTGYQTISKERATGSFAVVSPEDLSDKLQTSILGRLEGKVAGLTSGPTGLTLRGISTLKGNTTPLIVLDGMPFSGDLSSINPSTISNVTVLKDAAAASIYGARAANGVIVVTTKKGVKGHLRVSYDGSVTLTSKPKYKALNQMSSSELVDHLLDWIYKMPDSGLTPEGWPFYQDPVQLAISRERNGLITREQLERELEPYRSFDNEQQLAEHYLRTGLVHQHNVSLSGGSEKNNFLLSLNYQGTHPTDPFRKVSSYGLSLNDRFDLTSWLHTDVTLSGSFANSFSDQGAGSFSGLRGAYPSYIRFFDNDGAPVYVPDPDTRSEYELQRLVSLGTYDLHYNPYLNRGLETVTDVEQFYRLNLGLTVDLPMGLTLALRYAGEVSNSSSDFLMDKRSQGAMREVVNAAILNPRTQKVIYNVPEGGQLFKTLGRSSAQTFRAQLSYLLDYEDHYVTALTGLELRDLHDRTVRTHYFGYDDNSLAYVPVNPELLANLIGTLASSEIYRYDYSAVNGLSDLQDRFFSFYANASYSYGGRYDLTGSIRIDQSNLFGTDPRYQYRPLWSLGAGWHVTEEIFMEGLREWLSHLVLRATYGIGGNIPKNAGPYLTFTAPSYSRMARDFTSTIPTPPNPALRWERTATTNLGVDFALFRGKVQGSLEWYHKYTDDLLAERQSDPTLGWNKVMLNYGSMRNTGIEMTLSSDLHFGEISWTPSLVLSINHNKLLNVQESNPNTYDYTKGNTTAVGYPLHSIFSFPTKGLSPKDGQPIYLHREPGSGKVVETTQVADLTLEDLVFSGSSIPTFTGSLSNSISYKGLTLSLMLLCGGGNVFRAVAPLNSGYGITHNGPREYLLRWHKPGDENIPGMNPPITGIPNDNITAHAWPASTQQILRGDYIRLSDLSLSYHLPSVWTQHLFRCEDIRLTAQLRDLVTIGINGRGYDPLAVFTNGYGYGYRAVPLPTTFALGASINF